MALKAKPEKKMADTDPETKITLRAKTNLRSEKNQLTKQTPATKSEEMPEPELNQNRERGKSCQEIERRAGGEVAFLRLTLDHGHVSMTQEAFFEKILLPTPSKNAKYPGNLTSLPTHLVAISFLRNESHANVYLVALPSYPSRFYHAHAFLTDVSGNWSSFSKRKMDRLRKSQGFYTETVQRGRKIIIMDTELKADEEFCIKRMQREFPPLLGTRKTHSSRFLDPYKADNGSLGLKPPTNLKKDRDSYAAVVQWGRRKKHVDSNHRAYKAWKERKERKMQGLLGWVAMGSRSRSRVVR
ncbi:hypothetical protein V8E51_002790 [Hyaloscypha variabilis]